MSIIMREERKSTCLVEYIEYELVNIYISIVIIVDYIWVQKVSLPLVWQGSRKSSLQTTKNGGNIWFLVFGKNLIMSLTDSYSFKLSKLDMIENLIGIFFIVKFSGHHIKLKLYEKFKIADINVLRMFTHFFSFVAFQFVVQDRLIYWNQ